MPLSSLLNETLSHFFHLTNSTPSPTYYTPLSQSLHAFFHAINFTDNLAFFSVVVSCDLVLVLFVVFTWRRMINVHMVLIALIFAFVYLSERINAWMALNYKLLTLTENYFDANGIFYSTFVSAPLLLICVLILFEFLMEMCDMMVLVKRRQLMSEIAARDKKLS
uniref:Transmembrane protein 18 n=1 Tax=Percolomonas cosmopolitus TaxID=63605 RepID=A0A7S1KRC8_9EUKA|eukprot:CAMPEP_0117441894 /NCGR_PEP_ID=MMETSP0759-20121206/3869_1 /TAXON_ID=63605 /ORGANISM="Percolomonas cosmopolitus, Strain WS" /LENGTH=164 /DNA_ID=CAMNT_0005233761 /DNA_START=27 /DNA_END=521 /DNA_ORIENTATION=+